MKTANAQFILRIDTWLIWAFLFYFRTITKTRLFKYIENFTSKKGKFSDKKISDFFMYLLKT